MFFNHKRGKELVDLQKLDWTESFKSSNTITYKKKEPQVEKDDEQSSILIDTEKSVKATKKLPTILKYTAITTAIVVASDILTPVILGLFQESGDVIPAVANDIVQSNPNVWTPESEPALQKAVEASAKVTQEVKLNGWEMLISKILVITDYLMDGVIIFAGISWMFGNRTKAIELLFGAGVGYLIIRHHEDIKNFFALL